MYHLIKVSNCQVELCYVVGNGQQGLSDVHLVTLSSMITEPQMLRNLAVVGLGMKNATVDSRLNKDNINDASYEVLSEWRKPRLILTYVKL